MAYTFNSETKDIINFDEFIAILHNKISFGNEESLLDCVEPLFKLSNNTSFFTEYLNEQLTNDINNFQIKNSYSEQSYMIYDCSDFYIRITYWPKLSINRNIRDSQEALFSYDLAHDHNFPLLTAGYKGDGYRTKLWEYDYDKVIGYVDEKVDITFLEEVSLSKGKALYYRPSKDIHTQYAPIKEDSLAINIILKSYRQFDYKQYEFDIQKKRIKNILYGSTSAKFGLLQMTNLIHDPKTIELLHTLSTTHEIPQVRMEGLKALYTIEKSDEAWEIGFNDKDTSIRTYAELMTNQGN